jgi:hypothetical protein
MTASMITNFEVVAGRIVLLEKNDGLRIDVISLVADLTKEAQLWCIENSIALPGVQTGPVWKPSMAPVVPWSQFIMCFDCDLDLAKYRLRFC